MASFVNQPNRTHSAFDGISVKHYYTYPHAHRVVLFNDDEGVYDNQLVCAKGVANADNACICQGSPNTAPFYPEQRNLMKELFVPERPNMFPEPTPAVRCLIAERSPYGKPLPYEPTLNCKYH